MIRKNRSRLGLECRRLRRPNPRHSNVSPQAGSLEAFLASMGQHDQYGDRRGKVEGDVARVVLLNVDRIPERSSDSRQQKLFHWWRKEQVSIAMLTETGRYWPALPAEDRWHERTRGQFRDGIKSSLAYNIHQKRTTADGSLQHGGVGTFAIGRMAHRAVESGSDPSGIGRWSWIKLRGRILGRQEAYEEGLRDRRKLSNRWL